MALLAEIAKEPVGPEGRSIGGFRLAEAIGVEDEEAIRAERTAAQRVGDIVEQVERGPCWHAVEEPVAAGVL